jgi:hypothetical protein
MVKAARTGGVGIWIASPYGFAMTDGRFALSSYMFHNMYKT